jgi:hypothetical protein
MTPGRTKRETLRGKAAVGFTVVLRPFVILLPGV